LGFFSLKLSTAFLRVSADQPVLHFTCLVRMLVSNSCSCLESTS
jgi:hypothetical protein